MERHRSNLLAAIVVVLALSVNAHPTPCNQGNDTMCLEGVRKEFERLDYWFGTGYADKCPGGPDTSLYCRNPDTVNKNIATRLLQTANYNVENISQFLHIRWQTPKGHYMACGHTFHVDAFCMSKDLDNTHTIYYDSWIMAHQPRVIFTAKPGVLYTMVAYDVGNMLLGGIWANIAGGDIAFGQVLYPYMGPAGAIYEKRNPYVFALFEQNAIVNIQSEKAKIVKQMKMNNGMYKLDRFISSAMLQGPVGIGYVVVKSDAHGIQRFRDSNILNNCPHLVAMNKDLHAGLKGMHYYLDDKNSFSSYRSTFLTGLKYDLRITYYSPAVNFTSCCEHVEEDKKQTVVDPLSEDPLKPLYTSHRPEIHLTPIDLGVHIPSAVRYYMLFMLDVTNAIYNSSYGVTVEWQVANIIPGDDYSGDEVLSYRAPIPRYHSSNRTYVFVVITQPTKVRADSLWMYTGEGGMCPFDDFKRCNFDLGAQMESMNSKLVAVSMFHSKQDAFARAVLQGNPSAIKGCGGVMVYDDDDHMLSEEEVCYGVEGYERPCPSPYSCEDSMDGHHGNHHGGHNDSSWFPNHGGHNDSSWFPNHGDNNDHGGKYHHGGNNDHGDNNDHGGKYHHGGNNDHGDNNDQDGNKYHGDNNDHGGKYHHGGNNDHGGNDHSGNNDHGGSNDHGYGKTPDINF